MNKLGTNKRDFEVVLDNWELSISGHRLELDKQSDGGRSRSAFLISRSTTGVHSNSRSQTLARSFGLDGVIKCEISVFGKLDKSWAIIPTSTTSSATIVVLDATPEWLFSQHGWPIIQSNLKAIEMHLAKPISRLHVVILLQEKNSGSATYRENFQRLVSEFPSNFLTTINIDERKNKKALPGFHGFRIDSTDFLFVLEEAIDSDGTNAKTEKAILDEIRRFKQLSIGNAKLPLAGVPRPSNNFIEPNQYSHIQLLDKTARLLNKWPSAFRVARKSFRILERLLIR